MNSKVLLTMLPVFWPKLPPLGLATLKCYLRSRGIAADVVDFNILFYNLVGPELKKAWLQSCHVSLEENILDILKENFPGYLEDALEKMAGYDCIGFSCFKSNFKMTLEVVRLVKSRNKDIRVLLGGPEITRQYFKTNGLFDARVKSCADLIVIGEGEFALEGYLKGEASAGVAAFKQLKTLEDYPVLDYEGFDMAAYPRKDAVSVLMSRGCLRQCRFCSEKLLFKNVRTRQAQAVIEEMKSLKTTKGITHFIFHDSMINCDLKKLNDLCDCLLGTSCDFFWEAQMGVRRDMETGLMEKMKRSGCYNLFIGLESGCDRTLGKMNKGFTSADALDFFRRLKTAGLNFGISLMVGYPGESEEDFQESLSFVVKNRDVIPKVEQVNPFVYYDGTDTGKDMVVPLEESLRRMDIFRSIFKKHGIKTTNAFIGNLLEKDSGI